MADAAGVDYVLSLTPDTIDLAEGLRATPVLITEDPDDLDGLDRIAAHMERLDRPYLLDSILAPINSGFAASLARYVEVRRRHPEAGLLMGIGNLTELTEADSTGVTALLIGFCQEVGIGAVLTTEVIGWARGAVRETVLASQIMHLAQRQARVRRSSSLTVAVLVASLFLALILFVVHHRMLVDEVTACARAESQQRAQQQRDRA